MPLSYTAEDEGDDVDVEDNNPGTAVVLQGDRKHYTTAEEVYGTDVEALVMNED
jgi:116 kDa U5 small nuclear ribonucleoprotein component N-terminus